MAFTSPTTKSIKAAIAEDGTRTYTQVIEVISDSSSDGPGLALRAPGVPSKWDTYAFGSEFDTRAYLMSKEVDRPDGPDSKRYLITLNYSTLNAQQRRWIDHPLDRPAEVSSTFKSITSICDTDTSGNAIANSAGQVFDPPIEKEDARKILTVTRNFGSYNGGLSYMNRTNSDAYLGAAVGTLRITRFDEVRAFEEYGVEGSEIEVEFWVRTVEMEYRPEGWHKKPLDVGTKDSSGNDLLINGIPVTTPVLLDGAGAVLNPQTDPPTYADYTVYLTANYASMGLFS